MCHQDEGSGGQDSARDNLVHVPSYSDSVEAEDCDCPVDRSVADLCDEKVRATSGGVIHDRTGSGILRRLEGPSKPLGRLILASSCDLLVSPAPPHVPQLE